MATPQPGIFIEGSGHHHYLEYTVAADGDANDIIAAVTDLSGIGQSPATNIVIAFGATLWARLSPAAMPGGLSPFEAIQGADGHAIPATQRDLFVWIHGAELDDVFDTALRVQGHITPVADLAFEERGFIRPESRDLTGFIDGSANPKDNARHQAVLIPDGQTGAGGAFVLTQQWLHDLGAFNALAQTAQEQIIGRTKPDSIELEGDAMAPDSHVSRTDVSEDGVAQKIYRRSAPFGSAGRHGLYFLAFSCAVHRFDVQLRRMFGVAGDGQHDRLIEFSKPLSSAYWFAPSGEDLTALSGSNR